MAGQTTEVSALSNDLNVITAEINSYKNVAGQAIFEIGRRLKYVKENDLVRGEWMSWLESVDFNHSTAQKFIRSFEQFKDLATSPTLETGKIFEMLSLPDSVDKQEFIEQKHAVPSIGEEKTVDEMTVRELREVKKALKEAEAAAKQAELQAEQARKSEQIALNQLEASEEIEGEIERLQSELQKAKSEVRTVEVEKQIVPPELKREIEQKDDQIKSLKDELKRIEKAKKLDTEAAEKELKYLNYEANKTVLTLKLQIEDFLKEVAITAFRRGAIAASSDETKNKLEQGIEELEAFCSEMRLSLSGRIELSKREG
jgi:hypothetical protein